MDNTFIRHTFLAWLIFQIAVLKLEQNGVNLVNTLKGHNGSVQTLHWDGDLGWLFSGECIELQDIQTPCV